MITARRERARAGPGQVVGHRPRDRVARAVGGDLRARPHRRIGGQQVLEGRLEQLRTFEREYRTRLKTYLESQLEELGQRGSAAPVDSSTNNDGGGFNQFNRGNN